MSDANCRLYRADGIYTLGIVRASGWAWGQGHSHDLMMIIGIYATLGVFLLISLGSMWYSLPAISSSLEGK